MYKVTVRASDGSLSASRNVTITVTDVNEAPTIGGSGSVSYAENGTGSVVTYSSTDPDGDTISWSLPDTPFETDSGAFTISPGGALSFNSSPDYESPHDSNGDNVYKVTVRASDGALTDDLDVTITVTNVNEPPAVDSQIDDQTLEPGSSETVDLSGVFSDPDGDPLIFTVRSTDSGVAAASLSGSMLTVTASSVGSATITVIAADRPHPQIDRLEVADEFMVTVERSAPDKVAGLKGTPGSVRGEIALDWDPAEGADSYEVAERRRRLPLVPILYHWVVLEDSEVTIDLTNTSAVVHGLEGGNTYRHRVRGVRGVGSDRVEGEWSDHVDTTLTLPDMVAGLTGSPGPNHGEISLTWNAADGATGYQVRQKKPRRFLPDTWIELPGEGFGVAIVGATAVVSNLDPDKEYVYQVRGTNVHGEGGWSDSSEEIAVRDERPAKPQGLVRGTMRGNKGIFLRWDVAAGAQGYEVDPSPMGSSQQITVSGESAEVTGLTPGTEYSFRVRSWKPHGTSRLNSPWSDTVQLDARTPTNIGHQKDHIVLYMEGSITSAPSPPAGVPTPAAVISAAIGPAAGDWNTAATAIAGKNLTICESSDSGCHNNSNHDGGIVTVKTVNMNNKSTAAATHGNHDEGCGRSVACVKFDLDSSSDWDGRPGQHLGDMSLILEEPAYECRGFNKKTGTCAQHARIYWTDVQGNNRKPVPNLPVGSPPSYYYSIGPLMIHEFGHTLGLSDFYADDTTGLRYLDAVMENFHDHPVITAEDKAQLRAIYAIHDSGSH